MLREWIKNIPTALLEKIYAAGSARGLFIWRLAVDELEHRRKIAA